MPESPPAKLHIARRAARTARPSAPVRLEYAELHCLSNFSFLRGASHPEELVVHAAQHGYRGLAITDQNSLAGVVRAHLAAKDLHSNEAPKADFQLIIGAEITPVDGDALVLLAPTRSAYARLSRLITRGRLRSRKGECRILKSDVLEACTGSGLIGVALDDAHGDIHAYREALQGELSLALTLRYDVPDALQIARRSAAARRWGVPLTAANAVHYHAPERRPLQDVLTCIREKCTLADAGDRLFSNAERHLRPLDEIARRYTHHADDALAKAGAAALEHTLQIAERCGFSLDELRYEYPSELTPPGISAMDYLEKLTWEKVAADEERRRREGRPPAEARVMTQVRAELSLIRELRYEHYFLTVYDLVRFARERGILCQGRGSAANSAVCYYLEITAVDPSKIDVLFERFISRERNEPPDIDVDFEHERREEVFQYIYEKYGRERAGITAEVITYRPRSAIREVGKALGLSLDRVDAIAKSVDWFDSWRGAEREANAPGKTARPDPVTRGLRNAGLDPADKTVQTLVKLVRELLGFPRHLSQHVGGFVITESPLCEIVPLENGAMPDRTFIEWDKDDIDALGILKVDCLSLGMLTAIRKALGLVQTSAGPGAIVPRGLADIPSEDPRVYDMMCRADTVGVFQIESRAQMSMLPRLRPRCFYDLVIQVAIVRPGPIQGGMVHPYLRRRSGQAPVTYPSPEVEAVLKKTLGVPLFQEQVMRLAVVAAGFTPGEADQLRRAMAAWRRTGVLRKFQDKLVRGMLQRGYAPDFAEQIFRQIQGFGEYGFPESHAASFANLVYASAWLKHYHPAAYCGAMINSQPMGFYAPAQLVRDARDHGVEVRAVDYFASDWDCTLEPVPGKPPALRLGFRLVRGLSEARIATLIRARESAMAVGRTAGLRWLARQPGVAPDVLVRLAAADAFRCLGLDRREALWQLFSFDRDTQTRMARRGAPDAQGWLFEDDDAADAPVSLPATPLSETVIQDYDSLGLSLRAHPLELIRPELDRLTQSPSHPDAPRGGRLKVRRAADLAKLRHGRAVAVAGLVTCRQRPGTAGGIVFMTLEDETGIANLVIKPEAWDRNWRIARSAVGLIAQGVLQRQGDVIHLIVSRLFHLPAALEPLRSVSRDFH